MLALECPQCAEEVQLDGRARGHFVCPHCNEEFEWGPEGDAFGETLGSFLGFFFITTVVFFCLTSGWLFLFEGVRLDEALGLTLFLAIIIAPVWIPIAFIPFFIHRGYLFIQRLRETS
ncbi:MAG: hypothetical protein DWC05_07565 [Candidatus Poseidoniales archaeon]|nr:MAG: hypothetical protein DWC05_07565 [Candidatus Poseidoniales archaeon]